MSSVSTNEVKADLSKHEAVCAERWLEILHRVQRLERFVIGTLLAVIGGMGGILSQMLL
jgi:hypothetical protein|tara:strand:- start:11770 stop:11946 length:177 start_codon:yes stop_codon:yes gene_type:complete